MPETSLSSSYEILVDGAPLDPLISGLIQRVTVDNSMHLPDMFELTFRDPARQVIELGAFIPASEIIISADGGDGVPTPLIVGEVTSLEMEYDVEGSKTIIRGYDLSNRLMR